MALSWIDITIIISILLFFIYVGTRAKSTDSSGVEAYFLGDRKLPWWLAGTSMVATTFAADTPLAVNELVVKYGISGNWLWWNMLAGGMLTSLFFAHLWRRAHITTDVELIHIRYSGKEAKFLRAFKSLYMGIFMNVLIIGWVNLALISLIEVFFDIHDKGTLLFIIFICMIFVFIYSGFSGFLSVIYTDFVQFILAMTGSVVLAYLVINSKDIGGLNGLISQLNESQLSFFPSFDQDLKGMFSISIFSFFTFISMPWWTSWYPGAEPGGGGYIAQRIMGAKDEKNAVYSSLFFQIAHYCIRPWPWILVGLSTIIIYGNALEGQERMGYVWAMKDFLPEGLRGVLLASFLAAYMSTISTQLNWGASYMVNDFYVPFLKKEEYKYNEVRISQLSVIVLILFSVVSTAYINSISEVWSLIIKCGAGLGLVLILRWYWWRVSAWSEISASIAPFIAYAFCRFYMVPNYGEVWNAEIIDDPRSFVFIVVFTTIVWIVVTYLTPKTDIHILHSFYNRVRPDGFWPFHEVNTSNKPLYIKLALWVVTIIGAYSFLFSMGAYLLNQPMELYVFVCLSIASLLTFWYLTKKFKVFASFDRK